MGCVLIAHEFRFCVPTKFASIFDPSRPQVVIEILRTGADGAEFALRSIASMMTAVKDVELLTKPCHGICKLITEIENFMILLSAESSNFTVDEVSLEGPPTADVNEKVNVVLIHKHL